jgi:hypothetical protein
MPSFIDALKTAYVKTFQFGDEKEFHFEIIDVGTLVGYGKTKWGAIQSLAANRAARVWYEKNGFYDVTT